MVFVASTLALATGCTFLLASHAIFLAGRALLATRCTFLLASHTFFLAGCTLLATRCTFLLASHTIFLAGCAFLMTVCNFLLTSSIAFPACRITLMAGRFGATGLAPSQHWQGKEHKANYPFHHAAKIVSLCEMRVSKSLFNVKR